MDWSAKKTDDEMAITHSYAERGLLYSFLYKLNIWLMCALFSCMPLLPRVMDAIRPLNESRQRLYIYPAYYFVDSDTYYYYIIGYTFVCLLAVASIMVGTDMIMIYLVQHACGLLITAGYRFKHTVGAVGVSSKKGCVSVSDTQYRQLCSSVWSHNKAIQIIRDIESVYAVSMFVQVGVVMVAFSITLVMVAVREFSVDLVLFYIFVVVQIIHILFLTIQGQFVINSHDVVYRMIYEAMWYEQSPKAQALYVLALRRCLTPPVLTAGGLIPLNLNSFAEIVKASVSYFTVLKSS
ncbi:uncharacterized protein LOC143378842 [Andrena cerasifolii]|uniref:uncharacterized protein LOC143378842 n=1 Tax=Andrena cerasifolii TaxID=2819439 RepID=UPI0040377BEE